MDARIEAERSALNIAAEYEEQITNLTTKIQELENLAAEQKSATPPAPENAEQITALRRN